MRKCALNGGLDDKIEFDLDRVEFFRNPRRDNTGGGGGGF